MLPEEFEGWHDIVIAAGLRRAVWKTCIRYLGSRARTARAQTDGLSTKTVEDDWIDDFESCIRDIDAATVPTAYSAVDMPRSAAKCSRAHRR